MRPLSRSTQPVFRLSALLVLAVHLCGWAAAAEDDPLLGGGRRRRDEGEEPAAEANLSETTKVILTYEEPLPPDTVRRSGGLVGAPQYIIEKMKQEEKVLPAVYAVVVRPQVVQPERGPWEVRLDVGKPTKFIHPQIKRSVQGSLEAEARYLTLKLGLWSRRLPRPQADRLVREGELRLSITDVLEAIKTWRKSSDTIPLTLRRPTAGEIAFFVQGQEDRGPVEELYFDVAYVVRVRPRGDRVPEGETIRVTLRSGPGRLRLPAHRSGEGDDVVFTSEPFTIMPRDDGTGLPPEPSLPDPRAPGSGDAPDSPSTEARGDPQ